MIYTELIVFLSYDIHTNRRNNPSWKYLKELRTKYPEISKLVNLVTVVYCEDQPEVSRSFDVKVVPTSILLVDDSETSRIEGVMNLEEIAFFVLDGIIGKSINHS